ncbi:MAG: SCO family protein [Ignavibacteriae bacterium]|nr:SCO family protein [Ignavibacteriota bacterium]
MFSPPQRFQVITTTLALALLFAACSRKEQKPTDLVTFPLKGVIVEIDSTAGKLVVAHEEIPDYMMAMTMPFRIKEKNLFPGLNVGDSIAATLAVSRTESWLETITVIGKGEVPDPELIRGKMLSRVFKTGDTLPDETYLNQDGKKVKLSSFRGKAIALTFIYTRCPLPDFCIRMSNHFASLQKILLADRSVAGKWQLLTISFDPKFDSPKVLKEYGRSYRAEFSSWDFLTDTDSTGKAIMKLADGFGLTYENDEGGLISHNLRTVVLDKEGKLLKVFLGNEWTPAEIADELKLAIK